MQDNVEARAAGALQGLRVIDFSHFIAGPFCTLILADLGADIVKIENAASNGDNALRHGDLSAASEKQAHSINRSMAAAGTSFRILARSRS